MKRSIASVKDFAEFFNKAIQHRASDTVVAGKYVARKVRRFFHQVSQVSLFMQTTKGRDKICCLIQYLADLYEACIKFSNIPEIRDSELVRRRVAQRIRESMKNGRKIFKFLKFFDSIRLLSALVYKNKPMFYKSIMSTMHVCNFFYYIADHIIWGANVGVLNEILSSNIKGRLKGVKDSFSLGKAILKLLKAFFDYKLILDKEQELVVEINQLSERCIMDDAVATQSAVSLIASRAKRRQKQLNFIVTLLRIVMLLRRLKLFGLHQYISKIFYASSGLVVTGIAIGLQLSSNPNIVKIEKTDEKTRPDSKKLLRTSSFVNQSTSNLRKVKSDLENVLIDDSENEGD